MSRLLLKLGAFFTLLLATRLVFMPFDRSEYDQRAEALRVRPYSAVFIGSSRTKCAIIPAYFDQVLHDDQIVSYNFGVNLGLVPATLDWGEELIDENPSLKHVFIELTGSVDAVAPVRHDRRRPGRRNTEHDPTKIKDVSIRIDEAFLSIFKPILPQRDATYFDLNRPLDQLGQPGEPCIRDKHVSAVALENAARRSISIELNTLLDQHPELSVELRQRIATFLDRAASRGVSVHFFVPPLIESDKEAKAIDMVYRSLPAETKLAVNRDGPGFSMETAVDEWHLDQNGALIFTRRLADEFVRIRPAK